MGFGFGTGAEVLISMFLSRPPLLLLYCPVLVVSIYLQVSGGIG